MVNNTSCILFLPTKRKGSICFKIVRNECHYAFFFFLKAEQNYDFSLALLKHLVLSSTKAVITLHLSVRDQSD